ncbi:MAG: hypothetical protein BWX71_02263 [Deltaproteobacteria bacterium ADurb.Bin072]|nr:MAG: hypothetical protein BWX71_02263 [Deltaproteobacteria bacterium ADurb.Bin072]
MPTLVMMPVVPFQPRNRPTRSGRGALENQAGTVEHEPSFTTSPVPSTASTPVTISEWNPPSLWERCPEPCMAMFPAMVAAGGASGRECLSPG